MYILLWTNDKPGIKRGGWLFVININYKMNKYKNIICKNNIHKLKVYPK